MDDDTALHDASINGHLEVAQLLIDHGADVVRQGRGK
jgi:ankyrin repeat protein